jgi:hypothetical protein
MHVLQELLLMACMCCSDCCYGMHMSMRTETRPLTAVHGWGLIEESSKSPARTASRDTTPPAKLHKRGR